MKIVFFILLFNIQNILNREDVKLFKEQNYKEIVTDYQDSPIFDEALYRFLINLYEEKRNQEILRYIKSFSGRVIPYYNGKMRLIQLNVYKRLKKKKEYKDLLREVFKRSPELLSPQDVREIPDEKFNKGKFFLIKGKYEEAIENFKDLDNRDNSLLRYYIGYAYFRLGEWDSSLKYLSISYKKKYRWYYERSKYIQGIIYTYLDENEEALKKFLSIDPEYLDIRRKAMKEIRLLSLRGLVSSEIEEMNKMNGEERSFFLIDRGDTLKVLEEEISKRDKPSVFLAYILANLTGDKEWYDYLQKEDPFSVLALRERGICTQEENIQTQNTALTEELFITGYFDLNEIFDFKFKHLKDLPSLYYLSSLFYQASLPYYGLKTARKIYHLVRRERRICFPDTLLYLLFPLPFKDIILEASNLFNLDPFLLWAIIRRESMFKPNALSPAGARGVMQLMPSTAKEVQNILNFNSDSLYNPYLNIFIGAFHFRELLDSLEITYLALAAYNAGLEVVNSWIEDGLVQSEEQFFYDCPYEETRKYVFRVLSDYSAYKLIYGGDRR